MICGRGRTGDKPRAVLVACPGRARPWRLSAAARKECAQGSASWSSAAVNPRREAAQARAREAGRARQEEYQAQVRRAAREQAASA
ncbi:hypothetical protein GCM10010236_10890 [Streptomyces eurythermus]|nr:hypothetical protein GCM10010236_10890 [Streptomyces eurythermus]